MASHKKTVSGIAQPRPFIPIKTESLLPINILDILAQEQTPNIVPNTNMPAQPTPTERTEATTGIATAADAAKNPTILGMTPDVFSALAGGLASALAPPQFGPTGQYIGPSAPGQVGALMQQRAQSNMLMQMLKEAIGKKQGTSLTDIKGGEGTELEPFRSLASVLNTGGKY